MIKTIILAIDKKLENAPYDRTVRGKITRILPNNKYEVLLSGKYFKVKSKLPFNVGDVVNILIPNNNIKNMVIMLDKIDNINQIKTDIENKLIEIDNALTDIGVIASGFQYKNTEW